MTVYARGHDGWMERLNKLDQPQLKLVFGCSIIDPRVVTDPQAVADEYERKRNEY